MKKGLVIAEKSSLLKQIMDAYNHHKSEFAFELDGIAQSGHLLGLKLPSEIDEDMKGWEMSKYPWRPETWEYKVAEKKNHNPKFKTATQIFYDIKKAVKSGKYDFIIHAGDPDQEGELLVRETLNEIGNSLPVMRIWINASTENEFVSALKNMKSDNDPFYERIYQAGLARSHCDYLVGMNLSPVVSLKTDETVNIGRLKTFIIDLVAAQEEKVKNWKPQSHYGIAAQCQYNSMDFISEHTTVFETEQEAKDIIKLLQNTATVTSVETKTVKKSAPSLFELSSLQVAANKKYGYSSNDVLGICQMLYEKRILSYPRTSCKFLNDEADFEVLLQSACVFEDLKKFVSQITKEDIESVKKNKQYVDNAAVADEGHLALTPTTQKASIANLSEPEKQILHMVFAQYVAIFLKPMVQRKTKIISNNNGYDFVANGKVLLDPGFTELLTTKFNTIELPTVNKGDILTITKMETVEKVATPPVLYTDGTLIAVLTSPIKLFQDATAKTLGKTLKVQIGRPSTRGATIDTLIQLGYLEIKKGKGKVNYLITTEKGKRSAKNMTGSILCDAETTLHWEEQLDYIRKGTLSPEAFEDEIWNFICQETDRLKNVSMTKAPAGQNLSSEKKLGVCPKCGSDFVVGKFGPYCKGQCGLTIKKYRGKKMTQSQITKLLDGKNVVMKGLKSKAGKEYNMSLTPTGQFDSFSYNGKTYYSLKYKEEFAK